MITNQAIEFVKILSPFIAGGATVMAAWWISRATIKTNKDNIQAEERKRLQEKRLLLFDELIILIKDIQDYVLRVKGIEDITRKEEYSKETRYLMINGELFRSKCEFYFQNNKEFLKELKAYLVFHTTLVVKIGTIYDNYLSGVRKISQEDHDFIFSNAEGDDKVAIEFWSIKVNLEQESKKLLEDMYK